MTFNVLLAALGHFSKKMKDHVDGSRFPTGFFVVVVAAAAVEAKYGRSAVLVASFSRGSRPSRRCPCSTERGEEVTEEEDGLGLERGESCFKSTRSIVPREAPETAKVPKCFCCLFHVAVQRGKTNCAATLSAFANFPI